MNPGRRWLILDCNGLCHRAFHGMPKLISQDVAVSVVYGFLRDIRILQSQFMTKRVIFTWDVGELERKRLLPTYKKRPPKTPEEIEARKELNRQMGLLRKDYLGRLGFANNFWTEGYEADDVIASLCQHSIDLDDEVIIVSGDEDLYQLLSKQVTVYHPIKKETVTKKRFQKEYGLLPRRWAEVKAIAGCPTDKVPGVGGVAEKTACKFLLNQLAAESVKRKDCDAFLKTADYVRNLRLVRLPFDGTPVYGLGKDSVTTDRWNDLAYDLDMPSLVEGGMSNHRVKGSKTPRCAACQDTLVNSQGGPCVPCVRNGFT